MSKKKGRLDIIQNVMSASTTLGTLGSKTAMLVMAGLALEEDFFAILFEITIAIRGHTTDEGPLLLILADGDLSQTEVEECLAVEGPLDSNQAVERERLQRAVYILASEIGDGFFRNGHGSGNILRWSPPGRGMRLSDPEGWNLWAYNDDDTAFTTGTDLMGRCKVFGRWQR